MRLVLAEIRWVQVAETRLVLAEIRLVQVTELRLVQVVEMRLVQVAEMRLVPWVPPAFLEGGGGQNRARGTHLTATNMLSAFSRFNQREGGGGGVLSAFG